MTTSAIVLAGGRSSRFEGPKLQALVGGIPLLDLAVRAVAQATDEVIVVGPASGGVAPADLHALPSGVRVEVVHDRSPDGGPLVGLATGLAAASGDRVVVVGGDMPRLEAAVLRRLLVRLGAADAPEAVLLGQPDGARPLPMALLVPAARRAADAAIAAGETSLRAALARLAVAELAEDEWRPLDPSGNSLVDIDTPADLEAALGRPVP